MIGRVGETLVGRAQTRPPRSDREHRYLSTMCKPVSDAAIKTAGGDDAATKAVRTISRSELASHNTPSSAWCAIHPKGGATKKGKGGGHAVLDITNFASKHPGGDLILLAAGKDACVLFETYHPRGVPPTLVEKLRIGTMESGSFKNGSFYSWDSDFYPTLRARVLQRLEERGLSRRGSIEISIKAIFLLCGFWFSLAKMYTSYSSSFIVASTWSVSMGIFAALIGVNIQHDGKKILS